MLQTLENSRNQFIASIAELAEYSGAVDYESAWHLSKNERDILFKIAAEKLKNERNTGGKNVTGGGSVGNG